jgi:endonuclease/exonuclease/phosphatase (EEP) superfamily protein YafD
MSFHFFDPPKKNIAECFDFLLFAVSATIATSFFARYHWLFNLTDHLWSLYFIILLFASVFFLVSKKYFKLFFTLFLFFVCLFVILRNPEHEAPREMNSNIKVYYHNINVDNSSLDELSVALKKMDPLVIVLVEVTPESEEKLRHNLPNYSNTYSLSRDDNFGFLILSKIKFNIEDLYERDGVPFYIKFFIAEYGIEFFSLHLPPPLWEEALEIQREALKKISNEISKDRSYIILGDMNMTSWSSIFQDFRKHLRPGFYSMSAFSNGTWPSFLPSYFSLPIDHVLSNREFRTEIGSALGSDHKSIIINLKEN